MLADYTGGQRTDDVEETDQADRNDRPARGDSDVTDIGGKMRGDEGDLETADEEAGSQQQITPAGKCLAQGLPGSLLEFARGNVRRR